MQTFSGFALLVDAALKGTLVLLAATFLVILLRRGSAASRHLVWQFAVIAVLGLPVIKVVSPLRLPVLPEWRSPIVRPEAAVWPEAAALAAHVQEAYRMLAAQPAEEIRGGRIAFPTPCAA